MGPIRVALRLRFVKLPDTTDERIFRDVLRIASDPDDRDLDALIDVVDKKLSFMEVIASGAEVTLFYREENGDRVVIDAPYYDQLVRKWARTEQQSRKRRTKARVRPPRKQARVEGDTPLVLGDATSPTRRRAESGERGDARSASSSSSSSSSDGSSSPGEPAQTETIEIEVRMRAKAMQPNGPAVLAAPAPTPFTATTRSPAVALNPHNLYDTRHHSGSSSSLASGELKGTTTTTPTSASVKPPMPAAAPLTAANLARVATAPVLSPLSGLADNLAYLPTVPRTGQPGPAGMGAVTTGPQHLLLNGLTCPPTNPHFYLRCVVLSIRVKLPRAGIELTEMELCDAADPSQHISAISFDDVVQRGIRENLRGDRRQVIELRNVTVRRKTELDKRYETNLHPLQLRLERQCQVEVVQILPIPVGALAPSRQQGGGETTNRNPVVSVRPTLQPSGVLDLSEMAAAAAALARPPSLVPTSLSDVHGGFAAAVASSSSSSLSGAPRRTVFSFSSGGSGRDGGANANPGATGAGYSAALGLQTRAQQDIFLRGQGTSRPGDTAPPLEPGVRRVSVTDVHQREALLQEHANKELERKERLRRRAPVSQRCLLCTLDLTDEEDTLSRVQRLLAASNRNRGKHFPTLDELRNALSDPRRRPPGSSTGPRVVSKAHFVNAVTRTVQVVHPRCAHLCTAYQKGDSLEDIVLYQTDMQMCTLCGMPGATVSCYHPDCKEMYHTVCALFSNGYVNFGKRDPYMPCAACPRHTQVVVDAKGHASSPRSGHEYVVQGNDPSCWEDGIVFDSRVVEDTDLRDPDENGGL